MNVLLAGLLAFAALAAPVRTLGDEPKPLALTFGVYPSDKATVMYQKLTPVLEYLMNDLEKRLARPVDVQLTIFKSYEDGIDALAKGQVDFVRFGPASYIRTKSAQPAIQLLAMEQENGSKRFKGVIIVKKDSAIQSLADLRGKKFAFGDPNSTIGRYLVQADLLAAGLHASDLASFAYLDRHDKVASAVEMGDFDAGSVQMSSYEKANEKGTLRILESFDNVTKPWVARQGLDAKTCAALSESLYALKNPSVLKELKVSGFVPTTDTEYQLVRDGMKQADEFGKTRSGT